MLENFLVPFDCFVGWKIWLSHLIELVYTTRVAVVVVNNDFGFFLFLPLLIGLFSHNLQLVHHAQWKASRLGIRDSFRCSITDLILNNWSIPGFKELFAKCKNWLIAKNLLRDITTPKYGMDISASVDQYEEIVDFLTIPINTVRATKHIMSSSDTGDQIVFVCDAISSA